MGFYKGMNCRECEHITIEPAGKKRVFFICNAATLRVSRRVLEAVPEDRTEVYIECPAWCKYRKGEVRNDAEDRYKGSGGGTPSAGEND